MIIGLILGDGSLIKKKYANGVSYFKYTQELVHKEYIEHIFHIFFTANLIIVISKNYLKV